MKNHILMFQPQFVYNIFRGLKNTTIRPPRKRPIFPGDKLSLRAWEGKPYRSKQRIITQAEVAEVEGIIIHPDGIEKSPGTHRCFWIGEKGQRGFILEMMARSDGFDSWQEMRSWFKTYHQLPFEGTLISWK